jgi:hypothetical protein
MSEPTSARQPASAHPDVARPSKPANSHDGPAPHPLADLHRVLGNSGVLQRLATPAVQPKLEVGEPDDKHEKEADAIAAAVVRKHDDAPSPSSAGDQISRAPDDEKKHPDEHRAAAAKSPAPAPAATKSAAPAAPGKGSPVPVPAKAAPHAGPPTKKAPGRTPGKGAHPTAAAHAPGAHPRAAAAPAPGRPAAHAVAAKGPAKADPKQKAAHDAKAKAPHKHPDVERARAKPHPKLAAQHKPDPKPKTGTKAKDHPGKDRPTPHHAGGPPKHIQRPANEASPAPTTQAQPDERRPDEPHVAAKAASPGTVPTVTPSVARTIRSATGGGQPLTSADRSFYEPRLGRDLSGVRIHNDPAGNQAAKDVKAKAFTYGQDVFFAAGRHQPGTETGRELMAHELAHTIQQRPGAKLDRKIQRQGDGGGGTGSGPSAGPGGVTRDEQAWKLTFPELPVPNFRKDHPKYSGSLTRPKGYKRSTAAPKPQRDVWIEAAAGDVGKAVPKMLDKIGATTHDGGKYFVHQQGSGMPERFFIGDPAGIGADLTTPEWDASGAGHGFRGFEVDHVLELQLGGTNTPDNLELLDRKVNGASGLFIMQSIEDTVKAYIDALPEGERNDPKLKLSDWRNNWEVTFTKAAGPKAGGTTEPTANDRWPLADIQGGKHFDPVDKGKILQEADPDKLGSKTDVKLFPTGSGGIATTLHPKDGAAGVQFFKPFKATEAKYYVDDTSGPLLADFTFALDAKGLKLDEPMKIPAPRVPGMKFAGTVERTAAKKALGKLGAQKFSPVEIDEADVGPNGLYATGRIVADLPIVKGTAIDLTIDGPKITISHTFDTGDFKLPPPLKVTGSSLTVSASTDGDLEAKGKVDARIERLGQGSLEAKAGTGHGLSLDGNFKFTSDFFTKADVALHYHDDEFSGAGELQIAAGKVTGVKSGSLKATYEKDHFTASGSATFDVPGIDSADLSLDYSEADGLTLTAKPKLKAMPGIKSGELSVTIKEPAGGGAMKLSGHGTAEPAIPNINAQLTVDYDDGAFLAKVDTSFKVGRIDGSITAGATNQPLDDKGLPVAGGAHGEKVVPFGSGSATVTLADGITGTAGIKLLQSGEVEVSGQLTVQKNLWDGKDLIDKELLHASTSVPIFPPVVLHVGAGLHFKVGYGPGVLSGSVGITYNPDHEDQAKIEGKLHLHASAYAGLELDTSIGLGLGGPGVSLTGNVVLGGELRINADLDNECDVTWSPSGGLKVTDTVKATLSPQFVIHLKASIELDLTVTDITLWHEDLGSFPFGSGLQAGLTWPVTYESGKPFTPSVDDIKVDKPDLNPGDLAKQILEQKGKTS